MYGFDQNALGLKCSPQFAHEFKCMRVVAMHAERADAAGLKQAESLLDRLGG